MGGEHAEVCGESWLVYFLFWIGRLDGAIDRRQNILDADIAGETLKFTYRRVGENRSSRDAPSRSERTKLCSLRAQIHGRRPVGWREAQE